MQVNIGVQYECAYMCLCVYITHVSILSGECLILTPCVYFERSVACKHQTLQVKGIYWVLYPLQEPISFSHNFTEKSYLCIFKDSSKFWVHSLFMCSRPRLESELVFTGTKSHTADRIIISCIFSPHSRIRWGWVFSRYLPVHSFQLKGGRGGGHRHRLDTGHLQVSLWTLSKYKYGKLQAVIISTGTWVTELGK